MIRLSAALVGFVLLAISCGGSEAATPVERAVTIETEACGHTSRTDGSGVLVGAGLVITAAHVVIGASALEVEIGEETLAGEVIALDVAGDLALLAISGVSHDYATATDVNLAPLNAGDVVTVYGGNSGVITAQVSRRLLMTVDDIRSEARSERSGFELDAAIGPGDSGAGVFDVAGRLVGIVFAVPTEREAATFAVDMTEILEMLAAPRARYRCNDELSVIEDALE